MNKPFFRHHPVSRQRVIKGLCPVCRIEIASCKFSEQEAVKYSVNGLCPTCQVKYDNSIGRALRLHMRALDRERTKTAEINREIESRYPTLWLPPELFYYCRRPKIEPSYVIENREISQPHKPNDNPKPISLEKRHKNNPHYKKVER